LPYLSRSACRRLTVAQRVRLIAQSLVLYSRWYDLPAFLPGLHDAFGFARSATRAARTRQSPTRPPSSARPPRDTRCI
jgi:hypothetical protein